MKSLRDVLRRAGSTFTEGRGTIVTTASLHPLEGAIVRDLLPRGMKLQPGPQGPRFLFLFSHCSFSSWFGDMAYREMLFALPDVTAEGAPPSLYFRRLYLDQDLPRLLGNFIYGWEKLPARLTWEGHAPDLPGLEGVPPASTSRVETPGGGEILTAHLRAGPEPSTAWRTALFEVLAQPVISQSARRFQPSAALTHGGPFLRTHVHIAHPEAERAQLADIRFGAAFDPPALAGLKLDPATALLVRSTQVVSLPVRIPDPT